MPPKVTRTPMALQSSPPNKSFKAYLRDAIDDVNFEGEDIQESESKQELTKGKVNQAWWLHEREELRQGELQGFDTLKRNVEAAFNALPKESNDDLVLKEQRDLLQSVEAIVGTPDLLDTSANLRVLVVSLMRQVPGAYLEFLKQECESPEELNFAKQLEDKYNELHGTSLKNIEYTDDLERRCEDWAKTLEDRYERRMRKSKDKIEVEAEKTINYINQRKEEYEKLLKENKRIENENSELVRANEGFAANEKEMENQISTLQAQVNAAIQGEDEDEEQTDTGTQRSTTRTLSPESDSASEHAYNPDYIYGELGHHLFNAHMLRDVTQDQPMRDRLQTLNRDDLVSQFIFGHEKLNDYEIHCSEIEKELHAIKIENEQIKDENKKCESKLIRVGVQDTWAQERLDAEEDTRQAEFDQLQARIHSLKGFVKSDVYNPLLSYMVSLTRRLNFDLIGYGVFDFAGNIVDESTIRRKCLDDFLEHLRTQFEDQQAHQERRTSNHEKIVTQLRESIVASNTQHQIKLKDIEKIHELVIKNLQDKHDLEMKAAEQSYQAVSSQLDEHRLRLVELQKSKDDAELKLNQQVDEWKQAEKRCRSSGDRLQSELSERESIISDLKAKSNGQSRDIASKQSDIARLEQEVKDCKAEKAEFSLYKEENIKLSAKLATVNQQYDECRKQRSKTDDALQSARDKVARLEAGSESFQITSSSQADTLRARISELERERQNSDERLKETFQDLIACKAEEGDLKGKLQGLRDVKIDLLKSQTQVQKLENDQATYTANVVRLEKEQADLTSKLNRCLDDKESMNQSLDRIRQERDNNISDLENCQRTSSTKSEIISRWKEVLLTFVLKHERPKWTAGNLGDFDEIFTNFDQIRSIVFSRDGKLEKWWRAADFHHEPVSHEPMVLLLQIWYQLVHPDHLPQYQDVIDLVWNMQYLSSEHVDFVAACLEHALAIQCQSITNPSARWNVSQCTAWLRLVDLLCTFYNGHIQRLSFGMPIDMSTGRKSVFVDGLFDYVSSKLSGSEPHPLGRFVTEKARSRNASITHGPFELIADGDNLIVVKNAFQPDCIVHVLQPSHFALDRNWVGWNLIVNHIHVKGQAFVFEFDGADLNTMKWVNKHMADALHREAAGNRGFEMLPIGN